MDDSFENDLQGYFKARASATSVTKATDQKQEHSIPEVAAASYLHPEGFVPLPDQPNFSHDPNTQMWYDASTQVYSYYDSTSGTYIPIPPSQSEEISYDYYDYESYAQQEQHQHQYLEAPPESDATLRLRVLSSDILTVGGIVSMDASGLSFGRDRPLAGQGKRLRLSELDISRFHASIFLNREWIQATTKAIPQDSEKEDGIDPRDLEEQPTKEDSPKEDISEAQRRSEESVNPLGGADKNQATASSQSGEDIEKEETIQEIGDTAGEDHSSNDANVEDDDSKEQEEGELDEDGEGGDAGSTSVCTPSDGKINEQEGQEEGVQVTNPSTSHEQFYAEYYAPHPLSYEHAHIPTYEDIFQIYDCGSTHGTFLNGERLSPPKAASQPFTLTHLDQLKLGSTTFEVHAHEDGRVCADCQARDDNEIEVLDDKERAPTAQKPANNVDLNQNKWTIEQQRIEEMNRLKKKWATSGSKQYQQQNQNQSSHQQRSKHGLAQAGSATNGYGNGGYVDRAAKRRLLNPDKSSPPPSRLASRHEDSPEPPHAATGFHIPVGAQNKGYAMLSKMGWKEGTGLGLDQHGVVEPVQLKVSQQRAGLGSSPLPTQGTVADKQQQGRKETMGEIARRQARERFAQLQK
ncbi:hypothetical protein BGZ73_006742 [Actinomortierella ambigua]|nr:hypothetical protein BGZ73_006742 [Actinomortierella ambigua]